eukprot:TRINITY_DN122633_c0_g1_i1.p1 TRINITY_DN122633_c0_g1~~TRINITY_DN122633_c0_g1_i1.p1  ORF type:complete len:123 (+),score=16.67 TRINITY_DN122633_c0_g1_i1:127-495(+)
MPRGGGVGLACLFLLPLGAMAGCHQLIPSGLWKHGLCIDQEGDDCNKLAKFGWKTGNCAAHGWDHVCVHHASTGLVEQWHKAEDCAVCQADGGRFGDYGVRCPDSLGLPLGKKDANGKLFFA